MSHIKGVEILFPDNKGDSACFAFNWVGVNRFVEGDIFGDIKDISKARGWKMIGLIDARKGDRLMYLTKNPFTCKAEAKHFAVVEENDNGNIIVSSKINRFVYRHRFDLFPSEWVARYDFKKFVVCIRAMQKSLQEKARL